MTSDITPARMPRHLAVIMDGNGRWAERRRRPRAIGHRAGARAVNNCVDFCIEQGIGALTLFAFSSENWGRPEDEERRAEDEIQKLTDKSINDVDDVVKAKEQELMAV